MAHFKKQVINVFKVFFFYLNLFNAISNFFLSKIRWNWVFVKTKAIQVYGNLYKPMVIMIYYLKKDFLWVAQNHT